MKKLFAVAIIVSLVCLSGCSKLVCVTDQVGRSQISWMNLTSDECVPLFPTTYNDSMPNVSHDGKRVAFARADGIKKIIVRQFNAPGELILHFSPAFTPRWSPNGNFIAYTDGTKVCRVSSDGSSDPAAVRCTNPPPGYSDDYGHRLSG